MTGVARISLTRGSLLKITRVQSKQPNDAPGLVELKIYVLLVMNVSKKLIRKANGIGLFPGLGESTK